MKYDDTGTLAPREVKERRDLVPLGPHPLLLGALRQRACGGSAEEASVMVRRLRLLQQIEDNLGKRRKVGSRVDVFFGVSRSVCR